MPDLRWRKVSVFGCRIAYKSCDHIKAVQLIGFRKQQEPQAGWTLEFGAFAFLFFSFLRFSEMTGRLDMNTHDIRKRREQRPRGQGCFMQRHWTQDGTEGGKEGAGLRMGMRKSGCLSYCTK